MSDQDEVTGEDGAEVRATEQKQVLEFLRSQLENTDSFMALAARMNEGIVERSGLDAETALLVRIAAMAALGGGETSWSANIEMAENIEFDPEKIVGVLIAIAPVIGTVRTIQAADMIVGS